MSTIRGIDPTWRSVTFLGNITVGKVRQWESDEGLDLTGDSRPHPDASSGGTPVKIRGVRINNRRKAFEVRMSSRRMLLPFAKVAPKPTATDPVVQVFVDKEIGSEGFGYVLRSGRAGTAHVEQVLEYNKDPDHLRDQLLYKLTLEVQKRVTASALSRRELIRSLGTSATQFY